MTDRLLAADVKLRAVDAERFHLDLSEIVDEAAKISALPGPESTASEVLADLSIAVAHLASHWQSLARLTGWTEIHRELEKTYRSVNGPTRWWRRRS